MTHQGAWHPDPLGRFDHRYWDGNTWTSHVSTGGVQSIDAPIVTSTSVQATPRSDHPNRDEIVDDLALLIATSNLVIMSKRRDEPRDAEESRQHRYYTCFSALCHDAVIDREPAGPRMLTAQEWSRLWQAAIAKYTGEASTRAEPGLFDEAWRFFAPFLEPSRRLRFIQAYETDPGVLSGDAPFIDKG